MSNSLQIFPVSPLPANISRRRSWGEAVTEYESGAQQASTAWQYALSRMNIPFSNVASECRNSLIDFIDSTKGRVKPFLMKDPDEYFVSSAGHAYTGVTTFRLFDTRSIPIFPDSANLNIFSVLSAAVLVNGSDFTLDQDTGILTYITTPSATDSWSVRSTEFFKKWAFNQDYRDVSPRVWSLFDVQLDLKELP